MAGVGVSAWTPLAYCETCGRLFYTLIGKLCDVPTCRGYVHHIDRRRFAHSQTGERRVRTLVQSGDLVAVKTADGMLLEKRAMTECVRGRDFPVVWVCWEDEYNDALSKFVSAQGGDYRLWRTYNVPGAPWPCEDAWPRDEAPGEVISHERYRAENGQASTDK